MDSPKFRKRYGPFKNKTRHMFYVDIFEDGSRRSTLVHREVMENHLGRKLSKRELVHHKDENPENNDISNLEVMTLAEHNTHHNAGTADYTAFICPWCDQAGQRRTSRIKHNNGVQGKMGPFCSRSCAAKWSRAQQLTQSSP